MFRVKHMAQGYLSTIKISSRMGISTKLGHFKTVPFKNVTISVHLKTVTITARNKNTLFFLVFSKMLETTFANRWRKPTSK